MEWRSPLRNTPKYKEIFERAKKEIDLADHLLYITFPVIGDLKMLVAIIEHLISASKSALEALLEFDKYYKRLDPFPTNFAVMVDIFERKSFPRYNFDKKYLQLLKRFIELEHFLKKSSLQFKRKDKFVIAAEPDEIQTFDLTQVKKYLQITKDFISKVGDLIGRVE